jgi:asparagine synthetase B (glutamine-hydrolysing)
VREALAAAVKARLESDVPLGAYLSGGIDSSAVVTFMSRFLPEPPRTYSMALPGCGWFDEGPEARRLASELATHHTEVVLDAARLRDEIPDGPGILRRAVRRFERPAVLGDRPRGAQRTDRGALGGRRVTSCSAATGCTGPSPRRVTWRACRRRRAP